VGDAKITTSWAILVSFVGLLGELCFVVAVLFRLGVGDAKIIRFSVFLLV